MRFLKKFFQYVRPTVTIRHYTMYFTTITGEEHCFHGYNYIDKDAITCSAGEWFMIDIKAKGYIKDNSGNIYPLNNIVSIHFELDDEIENVVSQKYAVYYYKNEIEIDDGMIYEN